MKHVTSTAVITALVGGLCLSGSALAAKGGNGGDDDITLAKTFMTVRTDTQLSGNGQTILENCGASSGNQTATVEIQQSTAQSRVEIEVRDARPDTVYTVWLRMKGEGPGGDTIGGSPMTGGGATPLAPGSALDGMMHYSPPLSVGTANPTNGFTTDGDGDADFSIDLDFPVFGGAYPFQAASDSAVDDLVNAGSGWPLVRIPSPVVNPSDSNISAGFLLRVISHCTDGLGHGLSPGNREAWFQYP
jgi:hypothetical protein